VINPTGLQYYISEAAYPSHLFLADPVSLWAHMVSLESLSTRDPPRHYSVVDFSCEPSLRLPPGGVKVVRGEAQLRRSP
jgi:hypothetical protein